MNRIKKGDEVIIIAGKDKGKTGTVTEVLLKGEKYLIEGMNTKKKHVKANPNSGERGGITLKSMPVHGSNVKLYNSDTSKGSRVGIRKLDDGRLVRYFKSTGEVVGTDL
jgi:large subunit ribosomal protein L24